MELKQYFKASIAQRSLPEMQVELRQLRKELNELKQLLNK
jgi:UDP-3-O-[3-hydroxymyristoyl] glucosamine N-acyltransferase